MKIKMKDIYIPTGNEQVSIPTLYSNGDIESINFLSMRHRGLIEIDGDRPSNPLMSPILLINGERVQSKLEWERSSYWIPRFYTEVDEIEWSGEICAPVGERGFYYHLKVKNNSEQIKPIEFGLVGCWKKTLQTINESKEVRGKATVFKSNWNHSIIFELVGETPIFALAPMTNRDLDIVEYKQKTNKEIHYKLAINHELKPGEEEILCFYWGIGLEEVGAATAAKDILRKGWEHVREVTINWLNQRVQTTGEERLDEILNMNLFFNYFFATGQTLDTEESVLMTSRSPRYYVSAAYWDRDSLLWSFPSILITDHQRAKTMLDYVFTIQRRNIGIHSRYIDGVVLEPGFELDELCAPIIALDMYIKATDDWNYTNEIYVKKSIEHILNQLQQHRHPQFELYDTFLQPTDDLIVYPYLTYNNVLVWKVYSILSEIYSKLNLLENSKKYRELAFKVKEDINEHMIVIYNNEMIYAWSTNLEGEYNVYDEPPGSLQLLTYYGFCSLEDQVYQQTVKTIRSPEYSYAFSGCEFEELGCAHANHPWVLSIANSFLSGRKEQAKDLILRADMDGGIACESIDEHTGISKTGEHFATCAGFLAYAIYYAYRKKEVHSQTS